MDGNHLYVMRYGDRDSKIGVSIEPLGRWRQLRRGGARGVVRQWHRPEGDAQKVEAIAHRVLMSWRHRIAGQRERFAVEADTACLAVELAIRLLAEEREDEARRLMLREALPGLAAQAAPLPADPGWPVGYVFQPSAPAAQVEYDLLVGAGVDPARVLVDVRKPGVGLRRSVEMCQAGDTLVIAEAARLDAVALAALAAKGAAVHVLLAAG